jgi:peptide/nickel transport system permease protein
MSIAYIVYVNVGQYLLGKVLKWGPLTGFEFGLGGLRFAALPVMIGTIAGFGGGARLYRTFLLDEINQDYVRTARAKGVAERTILLRHVLKNALIPLITSTVAAIPGLILGGVVTENFFNIPGLGSALVDAINSQDFAVVRAMVFLGSLLYILGLILTDIAYALADPRVRLE